MSVNFFRIKRSFTTALKNPIKFFSISSYLRVYQNLFNKSKPFHAFSFKDKIITLTSSNNILKKIIFSQEKEIKKIINIDELENIKNYKDFKTLNDLFKKYKTDKHINEYDLIYVHLLIKYNLKVNRLLEIGIGSNNINIPGNMGLEAKPGASLFAFKEFFYNCEVYGADIDDKINLKTSKIKTLFVDQLSEKSLIELSKQVKNIDLIIDDGLHLPNANLLSFSILSKNLNIGGIYVIEDINKDFLDYFIILSKIINYQFLTHIFKTKKRYVFVAIKN